MQRAQHRAVAARPAQFADVAFHRLQLHFAQHMLAEVRCDGLHLLADGRVVVGQVAMVAAVLTTHSA